MTHKEVEEYILSLPGVFLDYPFDEKTAVYKVKGEKADKMMAIIAEGSDPLRISLKCDPKLAETLREKYESIIPGYHLNKRHWNTIICSGQLENQTILDLARHSYELVKSSD